MEASRQTPAERPPASPVPPGLLAVSPSKLNDFACPYRFNLVHVKQVDEAEEPVLLLGSLTHDVARDYFLHLKMAGLLSDHAALDEMARKQWDYRQYGLLEGYRAQFFGFIDVLRQYTIPEGDRILGVEARAAFDEEWNRVGWDDEAVAFGGILDLIHGTPAKLTIVDWTTAALGGQFALKKDLQVRMYGLLAWRHTKVPAIACEVRSLRTGAVHTIELGPDDHIETEERIRGERDRIHALLAKGPKHEWPAVPCSQCAVCHLACPYEADNTELIRITDARQAKQVHEELIRLEARKKELLGPLKAWVGVNGAVQSGGVEATFRTSNRYSYDTADVYQVMLDHGYPARLALDVLSVDRRKLTKCLKGNADLLLAVEALAKVKPQERFYPVASMKEAAQEGDDE